MRFSALKYPPISNSSAFAQNTGNIPAAVPSDRAGSGHAHRMSHIPGVIVQGRYDAVTPVATAWDLHKAWPRAEFRIVPDAGHASSEPGTLRCLVAATHAFAELPARRLSGAGRA